MEEVLHDYLVQRGKSIETIAVIPAHSEWLASAKECASEPNGACNGLEGGARMLAQRLRSGRNFEVLILPYLLFRTAKGGPLTARWDGVERPVETSGWGLRPGGPMVMTRVEIPATSLAVIAVSREGEKIFEGMGGLELAYRIRSPGGITIEHELREDLFADLALLREGVAIALDPLVPRPVGD